MKTIIPLKIIIDLNLDGSYKNGLLQYKINNDGEIDSKFHTMTIDHGIDKEDIDTILSDAKTHVEKGEGII
jgi:hypothetical protein